MKKEEMKTLLEKYPFLVYRNIFSNKPLHDNPEEDLEINEYTSWNGTGWEKIWKRFLQEVFKEYDKLSDDDKKKFGIFDSKEKYGTMRVSLSNYTKEMYEAENILFMLSSVTCQYCGKQPRDSKGNHIIWRTSGWITNLCKDCFKKDYTGGKLAIPKKEKAEYKKYEKRCKQKPKKYFTTTQFEDGKKTTSFYADCGDWLTKVKETTIKEKS